MAQESAVIQQQNRLSYGEEARVLFGSSPEKRSNHSEIERKLYERSIDIQTTFDRGGFCQ